MTGFESKRQMAQAKVQEEMQAFYTKRQTAKAKVDDDDDTQVYADTLLIVYQRGFADGKRAAQEQEPVTWRNAAIRLGEDLCSVGPFRYYDMTAEQWLDWALSVVTVHAPPPQRTWVGLTDKDWNRSKHNYDFQKGVDWAESILKEKNT